LMRQGSDTLKKLSLELGGHAPIIVCNDANVEEAVENAIISKFRNAGQTCVCGNRIYVQSEIYNRFIEIFTEKVSELKVGNGLSEQVDVGPLINREGVEKVKNHVEDALSKGADILIGGDQPKEKGNYFNPTVLKDVTQDMLIMHEETFGPIAPIQKFETIKEAIQSA